MSYVIQLFEAENDEATDISTVNFPNITINLLNLTFKILNVCFEVSYVLFKKIFRDIEREGFFSNFLAKVHMLIVFCKKEYE